MEVLIVVSPMSIYRQYKVGISLFIYAPVIFAPFEHREYTTVSL